MTGTDPAVEAAQRLAARWEDLPFDFDDLTAAAREALAPIRELHKPTVTYLNDNPYDPDTQVRDCTECETRWPCDTARFIYTSEELTNG